MGVEERKDEVMSYVRRVEGETHGAEEGDCKGAAAGGGGGSKV